MNKVFVQDFIRGVRESSRDEFYRRVEVPVMIYEEPKVGLSFEQGQTDLIREKKPAPLARELIRQGHRLPVFTLRQRLPGPRGQVRLGRTQENDLVLKDNTVSSRHAVFQQNGQTGTYSLQDLASMNGTHVNGSRMVVGKSVVLFDGDVLSFGDSNFLFFYPQGLYDVLRANIAAL